MYNAYTVLVETLNHLSIYLSDVVVLQAYLIHCSGCVVDTYIGSLYISVTPKFYTKP